MQVQDDLQFIDFTSEREVYVHFLCVHSRLCIFEICKIKFRMVSAQHFIKEAQCVACCHIRNRLSRGNLQPAVMG